MPISRYRWAQLDTELARLVAEWERTVELCQLERDGSLDELAREELEVRRIYLRAALLDWANTVEEETR